MKITAGYIVGVVIALVMVTVLFNMLPNILPTTISSVAGLFTALGTTYNSSIGAGPTAFALTINSLTGWFWVVGPFILVITIILGLFMYHRGRK